MSDFNVQVRHERREDVAAVRRVNELAFGRAGEADLVDRLRDVEGVVSLVAMDRNNAVVGHALFTPATIRRDADGFEIAGAALGPVAVLPELQRRGVGTALIETGMDELARRGVPFVVVLGHPEYYPRFGFEPARPRHGVRCKWDVPDDVFMIRVFDGGQVKAMGGLRGLAIYHPAFDAV